MPYALSSTFNTGAMIAALATAPTASITCWRHGDAPISPRKPLPDYIVEKRFAEPVATDTVVMATLASLAQMLVAAMERHGKGARRIEASFFRTDGAVRLLREHPPEEAERATRDAANLCPTQAIELLPD